MMQLFHEISYGGKLGTAFFNRVFNDPARRERVNTSLLNNS